MRERSVTPVDLMGTACDLVRAPRLNDGDNPRGYVALVRPMPTQDKPAQMVALLLSSDRHGIREYMPWPTNLNHASVLEWLKKPSTDTVPTQSTAHFSLVTPDEEAVHDRDLVQNVLMPHDASSILSEERPCRFWYTSADYKQALLSTWWLYPVACAWYQESPVGLFDNPIAQILLPMGRPFPPSL